MRMPWLILVFGLLLITASACATAETVEQPDDGVATDAVQVDADGDAESATQDETEAEVPMDSGPGMDEVVAAELGDDAVVTASGLAYREDVVGDGAEARACDYVAVDYAGRLPDGTEFDSSKGRAPFSFTPGTNPPQAIPGWDEGIQGMMVGGERTLVVPPELAYGEQGVQGVIPPNSVLVFDVALLDVLPRPEQAEAAAEVTEYTTAESGLEYTVLAEGDGTEAELGDRVHVHYTGWLEDGTMFDSSLNPDRCEAIAFVLGSGQVISGWDEGVAGMVVGEQRQLRIPAELGYGDSGSGSIPPNSTLIFDVQLIGVDKPLAP